MSHTINLTLGQKEALRTLVALRHAARCAVRCQKTIRSCIDRLEQVIESAVRQSDRKAEALARIKLDSLHEGRIEAKFKIIEIGRSVMPVCSLIDAQQVPRHAWLRALCVNESHWHSPEMLKYGQTIRDVICVLGLENSATANDAIELHPLKWCTTLAMMNATKTNPALGKFMHDQVNDMFGGVFGDWREPSLLERLGVHHG